jgi:hypothetical protein
MHRGCAAQQSRDWLGQAEFERALAELPKGLPAMRRWLKAMGAKPIDAATKRRLIAAGEWGMPKE